jgi:hypothetical protein
MYEAIMIVCLLKYSWNVLPTHCPLAFRLQDIKRNTSKKVFKCGPDPEMWPWRVLRPAACTASSTLSKNFDFISVQCVCMALCTNIFYTSKGWLTWRCYARATVGSISLSWDAQYTSLPLALVILVLGMYSIIILKLLWS